MIHVRPATPDDAAAVAAVALETHALHAAALPHVFQPPSEAVIGAADIARLIASPACVVLVAERDGAVVGYAQAEVQEVPASPYKRPSARLHLHAMGVTAAHRGSGAGSALLDAMRAAAGARGLHGLSLEVYAFNAAAQAFYAREGFVPFRQLLVADLHPPPLP